MLLSFTAVNLFAGNGKAEFIENLGQWNPNILYRVDIPSGALFLEKTGFTYSLLDLEVYHRAHDDQTPLPDLIRGHAFKMTFVDALVPETSGEVASTHYRNYFIGSDSSKWKSRVHSYDEVNYTSLYDGIDLRMYSRNGRLKYDLTVEPNADGSIIEMNYEGLDGMKILQNGDLELLTSLITIRESRPVAFQVIDGIQKIIPCKFELHENRVSFIFPKGYDPNYQLIIDPELVFATYVGSTANNFGSSATYDSSGHLYGAGTTFGVGYPTTIGAYQTDPALAVSGTTDIGISKFSPDGTGLLYSTYLGGGGNEMAHSIIVNSNDEIFIFGSSSSPDYPTSANAFQTGQLGGSTVNWGSASYGQVYNGGSDLIITRLSSDGTSLLASTYVGGTDNDGLNVGGDLDYNYGDPFRGEINVDAASNVYVASCTESADFPITAGAAQTNFGGGRDGVVFKMNSNLSSMIWATYMGGSLNDNAYSVQLAGNGEVITAGGTLSTNFPTTSGVVSQNSNGQAEGWVAKISPNGSTIMASTYIGTGINAYDQVYFVQLDPDDAIYVLGQTTSNMPIIPSSVYNNPNSGQFIQRLSNDLSTIEISTAIGTGSGQIDISPTAFLVSNCGQIYLSGWGGSTNNSNGNTSASTTNGLPISNDAFQPTTDGNDFYLMVLGEDASSLVYATYFGGGISAEHVDGGTSRFDKNGVVYQAVCAGCGNHDDFPSTLGAWSSTNDASCNLGVFKFDLNQVVSVPEFNIILGSCIYPIEVEFFNNSTGANTYIWNYGDGNASASFEEDHFYAEPGTYEIMLIAIDSLGCLSPDTATVELTVPVPPTIVASGTDTICALDTVPLFVEGIGIESYEWTPSNNIDNPTSETPNVTPSTTTEYIVIATDSMGCQTVDTVTVFVSAPPQIDAGSDAYLQPGITAPLSINIDPGTTILWSPTEGLSCVTCPSPVANPQETTTYYVEITDALGCTVTDSLIVYAYPTIYAPNAFTPGPTPLNTTFKLYGVGIADYELSIFSRWGQLIYNSTDLDEGWNGEINNTPSKQDVYVWKATYSTDLEPDNFKTLYGHVTLLRNMR